MEKGGLQLKRGEKNKGSWGMHNLRTKRFHIMSMHDKIPFISIYI
jgi:hypothetical protein